MKFEILDEMIRMQESALLKLARQINPRVTADDILQPFDFPELENHPLFRYEEGLLAGLKSAQIALSSKG